MKAEENVGETPGCAAKTKALTSKGFEILRCELLTVTASHTVPFGGGTGQEFPQNLLIPGDGPGNKWFNGYSGPSWVRIALPEGVFARLALYGFKSANDVPERDPHSWTLKGLNASGEWQLIHEVKGALFPHRYFWKLYTVDVPKTYLFNTFEWTFTANSSYAHTQNWGDGTQLSEISLFTHRSSS